MDNPYAPPADEAAAPSPDQQGGHRIEGDQLVVQDGARLPKICIKTGRRGINERTQKLMWTPVWARLLFGALGTLAGKKATLTYFLSDQAEHSRANGVRVLFISLIFGMGICFGAVAVEMFLLALLALIGLVVGVVMGSRWASPFRLTKIESGTMYLRLHPEALGAFSERMLRRRAKRMARRKKTRSRTPV